MMRDEGEGGERNKYIEKRSTGGSGGGIEGGGGGRETYRQNLDKIVKLSGFFHSSRPQFIVWLDETLT